MSGPVFKDKPSEIFVTITQKGEQFPRFKFVDYLSELVIDGRIPMPKIFPNLIGTEKFIRLDLEGRDNYAIGFTMTGMKVGLIDREIFDDNNKVTNFKETSSYLNQFSKSHDFRWDDPITLSIIYFFETVLQSFFAEVQKLTINDLSVFVNRIDRVSSVMFEKLATILVIYHCIEKDSRLDKEFVLNCLRIIGFKGTIRTMCLSLLTVKQNGKSVPKVNIDDKIVTKILSSKRQGLIILDKSETEFIAIPDCTGLAFNISRKGLFMRFNMPKQIVRGAMMFNWDE